ncbi:MAG: EFR1 family ferrodoxin [Muribaculaceae bacterium]|nr:EFR1 family ferrodoxin [Muribaculaceae bacterium]
MIFYFSGTGNTRYIAERLAQATGERLVSIAQAMTNGQRDYHLGADERIGICFPVHGWRPPFIVRDFIHKLRLDGYEHQYCYGFATCGDDVGLTFDYLADDLRSVGIRLDSVFSVIMPETYNFPFIDQIDTTDVAISKIAAACERFERLLPDVLSCTRDVKSINKSRWPCVNSRLLGSFFLKCWVTDSRFTVDTGSCIHCGKCAAICPVGNIKCPEGMTPQWLHNGLCTTCFSCYHQCPAHAIDFDKRTRGKRQYYFKNEFLPELVKKKEAGN